MDIVDNTVLIPIAVLLVVAAYVVFKSPAKFTEVTVGNVTLNAEIADTWPKQVRGLMFRQSLPSNQGMLFIFSSDGYPGIWMANMSIPIDILWIDSRHKVVDIVENAQPCGILCPTYTPKSEARYVLEVNAGFVKKHGIEVGDIVKF